MSMVPRKWPIGLPLNPYSIPMDDPPDIPGAICNFAMPDQSTRERYLWVRDFHPHEAGSPHPYIMYLVILAQDTSHLRVSTEACTMWGQVHAIVLCNPHAVAKQADFSETRSAHGHGVRVGHACRWWTTWSGRVST